MQWHQLDHMQTIRMREHAFNIIIFKITINIQLSTKNPSDGDITQSIALHSD